MLASALAPSNWIMPLPPHEGLGYPAYPEGMSFDHAAVEPSSGLLLFYVPTLAAADSYLNLLYYIPLEPLQGTVGYTPTGERTMQPVLLESRESSAYAGKSMSVVATVYTTSHAPSLVFTLFAGLYVRHDWLSGAFHPLGRCVVCPEGRTSLPGSLSVNNCYCKVFCVSVLLNVVRGCWAPCRSTTATVFFFALVKV